MRRFATAIVLLVPLVLCSCSVGRVAREAGEGAFDAARAYVQSPEGQAAVTALADRAVDAGISKLGKVAADPATPPWKATAAEVAAALLAGYATYQRGHRTGETKGWTDATGNGATPPKT